MSMLSHAFTQSKGLADVCEQVLAQADVRLNGSRPWDVQTHSPAVLRAALCGDLLYLGHAFVRGDWDCERPDELIARVIRASLKAPNGAWVHWLHGQVQRLLLDGGTRRGAKKVGHEHYDLGNELFKAMLDKRMAYSCAYWAHANNLDDAEEAKLDLICQKLGLRPGMRLLDIGCGWGSLVKYAAERYGVAAVGVTISKEQAELAQESCRDLPVEIRLQDYRDAEGCFDRIASVGMFEHVGRKHYREYMSIARDRLRPDGLFLLHCIGASERDGEDNPWIAQHIFPGGHIPAVAEVAEAVEGRFVIEDWHNFGADYDKTLRAWFERFDAAWPSLSMLYDNRFYRRWKLYLLGCAGAFRARYMQLWQIVLSPNGVEGGYVPVR